MAVQERRILFKHIDAPGYTVDIDCYLKHGGYKILKKALKMKPQEIKDEVKTSQLRGRGGAGFSCGMKWGLHQSRKKYQAGLFDLQCR
jgi:NADH-quinone oxidoreductase subunit F